MLLTRSLSASPAAIGGPAQNGRQTLQGEDARGSGARAGFGRSGLFDVTGYEKEMSTPGSVTLVA